VRREFGVVVVVAAALALAAPVHANPVDHFGFGARGPAMGNAQTAASIDAGAHYYNPGILATFEEIRINFGYQLADPGLTINDLDTNVNRSRGIAAGISVPGQLGGVKLAFGAGIFLPDDHVSRTRTLQGDQPRFIVYDNRPQRIFLAANASVQLTDELFVGAGIGYLSATSGGIVLAGRLGFPDALDSDLALAIDVDLETVRYAQAGLFYRALSWLDLGLAYRGGFVLNVDLAVRIEGDIGPDGAPPVVEDGFIDVMTSFQDLFQPEQFALGAQARLGDDVLIAFDLVWHRWSEFGNPTSAIDIQFDLKDFNELVDFPNPPPLPDANFHDIVVPHLGVEWVVARGRHTRWATRAGYVFEPSPAPKQTGETNFVDTNKHTASLGLGLELRELTEVLPLPFEIDLYGAYTGLQTKTVKRSSPVDRIGDYRAGGRIWQVGASTRWRF